MTSATATTLFTRAARGAFVVNRSAARAYKRKKRDTIFKWMVFCIIYCMLWEKVFVSEKRKGDGDEEREREKNKMTVFFESVWAISKSAVTISYF